MPDPGPAANAAAARINLLEQEIEALRLKYAEDVHAANRQVRTLQKEAHALQQDYEALRLQKGGFGFKMLMLSAFAGFIVGLITCYLFFRPTDARAAAFTEFHRDHQFSIEYELSHGHFGDAEKRLRTAVTSTRYVEARDPLKAMHQIVVAAQKGCNQRDSMPK